MHARRKYISGPPLTWINTRGRGSGHSQPMPTVSKRLIDSDLLRRHDVNGPRYTSYPTADRFVEAYQSLQHEQALAQRGTAQPLSLYLHIPFCEQLC